MQLYSNLIIVKSSHNLRKEHESSNLLFSKRDTIVIVRVHCDYCCDVIYSISHIDISFLCDSAIMPRWDTSTFTYNHNIV